MQSTAQTYWNKVTGMFTGMFKSSVSNNKPVNDTKTPPEGVKPPIKGGKGKKTRSKGGYVIPTTKNKTQKSTNPTKSKSSRKSQ